MTNIQINNYTVANNTKTLFNIEQASIHTGDKIGFTAANGAGKTTFLKSLLQKPTPKAIQGIGMIGYLPQIVAASGQSVGQAIREHLVALLRGPAKFIILDEPTANLDTSNRQWLIKQLQQSTKTFLIVSHDRQLLTAVATTIWYLEQQKLKIYGGNYVEFITYQEAEYARLNHAYHAHHEAVKRQKALVQKQREHVERLVKRVGIGTGADYDSQAKHLMKGVAANEAKLKQTDGPEQPDKKLKIKIQLKAIGHLNLRPLKLMHVPAQTITRAGHKLFSMADLDIKFGDHIGLIGDNGLGKTTFLQYLKKLTLQANIDRQYYQYHDLQVGYFDQLLQSFVPKLSILENIKQTSKQPTQVIYDLLGVLGFHQGQMNKAYQVLSGGEKVRAALAQVLLGDYQLLLLDEPTNYLDMEALTALEEFLPTYPGAYMLVSHDQAFVQATCPIVYTIDNQQLQLQGTNPTSINKAKIHQQLQQLYFKKDQLILDPNASIAVIREINDQIATLEAKR